VTLPDITGIMVRKLVETQFPQWASLPLEQFRGDGTDNAIFRLGDTMSVRLPRVERVANTASREHVLLQLFQTLPLDVPEPLALGKPDFGYPWDWSIVSWIEGQALGTDRFAIPDEAAHQMAEAILAIRAVAVDPAFSSGIRNNGRGAPLATRNEMFLQAAERLGDEFETSALIRIWQMALTAVEDAPPVWLHGDLHGGNLLHRNGRLSAIIDWGLAGVGDGACDLSAAWPLFDKENRKVFRDATNATEAAWLRGAGWSLSIACIFVAHYYQFPKISCDMSRRTIKRVLAEFS